MAIRILKPILGRIKPEENMAIVDRWIADSADKINLLIARVEQLERGSGMVVNKIEQDGIEYEFADAEARQNIKTLDNKVTTLNADQTARLLEEVERAREAEQALQSTKLDAVNFPVPTPPEYDKFLRGDGSWVDVVSSDENLEGCQTVFNQDGSIAQTFENGTTKTTSFNNDGSITQTVVTEKKTVRLTTRFNADGSITRISEVTV